MVTEIKNLPANAEDTGYTGREDPLEKEMAIQPSILAWGKPWIEEPGSLQSIGLDMAERAHTHTHTHTHTHQQSECLGWRRGF